MSHSGQGSPTPTSSYRSRPRLHSPFILLRQCQGNDVYKDQGVSRGFHVRKDHQPQRDDRRRRLQCTESSRQDARMRRSHGVVSRRDAENAEGNTSSSAVCRVGHRFLGHPPLLPIDAEGLIRKAAKDPEKARRMLVAAARRQVRLSGAGGEAVLATGRGARGPERVCGSDAGQM